MAIIAKLTHTSAKTTKSNVSFAASKAGRRQVNVHEVKQLGHIHISTGPKAVGGVDSTMHFCLRIENAKELLHKVFSVLQEK